MKNLNLLNLEGTEVLTRQQLKMVMGGSGSDGSGDDSVRCNSNNCSYYDIAAKVTRYGSCGKEEQSGPRLAHCACMVTNQPSSADSSCNA